MTRFFAPALFGLALFFTPAGSVPAAPQIVAGDSAFSDLEHQAFDLVNRYRSNQGLAHLAWLPDAEWLARLHSEAMARGDVDFGHDGFRERVDKLKETESVVRGAGENVFKTDDTDQVAEEAVAHWLTSPPHLHNIRGDFNYSGLGVARARDGTWYLTQLFVKITPPAPPPPPPTLNGPGAYLP